MTMIRDALEFLANQGTKAATTKVIHPEAEPAHVYLLDGHKQIAEPAPRNSLARGISTLVNSVPNKDKSAIWYSRKGIVVVIDDAVRRDLVRLPLAFSPQLATIQSWGAKSNPFSQAELILMLRTMFKRNMSQCPKLIDCLRNVRFQAGQVVDSAVGKGKASISKSIESNVTGHDAIPDEVYFNVPIFGEPFANLEGLIDVALETDGGTQRFTLQPVPGTIDKQITLAEGAIGEALAKEFSQDKLFYGEPFAN